MNRQGHDRPPDQRKARVLAARVVAGAVTSWIAAAALVWGLVPQLVADPVLAGSAAEVAGGVGAFALTGALAGAVVLLGLALAWLAPRRAAGRVLLLVAGSVATATGLLLLNLGTLQAPAEFRWSAGAALAGATGAASFVVAGLVACAAGVWPGLPGRSLVERMMLPETAHPAAPAQVLILPLGAALVVGWIGLAAAVLATHGPYPFVGMQFGMPILAGAVAAGWREAERDRLQTLGLAAVAGAASSWLFLLTLAVAQYYRFNPVGYVIWWGLLGALFGTIGYGVWGLLTRRSPRLRPRPA
jgi:hypothetical protein